MLKTLYLGAIDPALAAVGTVVNYHQVNGISFTKLHLPPVILVGFGMRHRSGKISSVNPEERG